VNVYQKGDLVRVSGVFKDLTDVVQDPDTVSLKVTKTDGTQTIYVFNGSPAVTRDSTGNYHVDVSVDQVGRWFYTWISTGLAQAAENGEFLVEATQ
jgi:hypothetical protein